MADPAVLAQTVIDDAAAVTADMQKITADAQALKGQAAMDDAAVATTHMTKLSTDAKAFRDSQIPPLPAGLTGYWKFDGNTTDSSGLGNNGVATGAPTYVAGKVGQAINLNGSTQYVTIKPASALVTSTAWTILGWFNPAGAAPASAAVYGGQYAVGDAGGYFGIIRDNKGGIDNLFAYNWDGSERTVGVPYTPGQLVHVAISLGGGVLSIYKAGALAGSVTSGPTQSLASNLLVGWGYGSPWNGAIDELQVYNRALTPSEVQQIYAGYGGTVDTTPPTVVTTSNTPGTATGNVLFTFTFSEPVTGFSAAKVTVTNGTKGTFTTVNSSTYTLVVTPPANFAGTMSVAVPAGAAADLAGNLSTAAVTKTQAVDTTVASTGMGPLVHSAANPSYFAKPDGTAVYLTGSHTWNNLQDEGATYPPAAFDFTAYLNWMQANSFNFMRLWIIAENPSGAAFEPGPWFTEPNPWSRPGPGTAADGRPKFDLNTFNQAYFDRMRARVVAAAAKGVYVSVMLFEGWSLSTKGQAGRNPWLSHPFNVNNNINNINGDPSNTGAGDLIQTTNEPAAILTLQQAYVRKVIDTVGDLDNVLYEITNESLPNTTQWQYNMINFIKNYESTKPKKHPVGMTDNANPMSVLFASPADWISPVYGSNYYQNMPANDGSKVILSDTDHLWGAGGDDVWVWESFMRGICPIFMDDLGGTGINIGGRTAFFDPAIYAVRRGMTQTARYAARMNLALDKVHSELCSSTYMLANPGTQYLAFSPDGSAFTVDLSSGAGSNFSLEWLNVSDGTTVTGASVAGGSAAQAFTPPFAATSALFLNKTGVADTTKPTVAITDNVPGTVTSGNVLYTFTFSEPVTGFDATDVVVTHGTKGAFTAVNSSTYTLSVTPESNFLGNMTVDVPAGAALDLAGNASVAATQAVQPVDTTVPVGTRTPLAMTLDFGGGRTVSFSESAATNLGDYVGPFVHQRCLRQVIGDIVVDFRPDTDGKRDEIIVELGSLYKFGAPGTDPQTASGAAPTHIGAPPEPAVSATTGSPSTQSGIVVLMVSFVDAAGNESAASQYYYWNLLSGQRLQVASPPTQANAVGYYVYTNDVRQTASPVPFGTTWRAPDSGLTSTGPAYNYVRPKYVAYRASISGGNLTQPLNLSVPVHAWMSRWRWQSAQRPVVRTYADLVAMKAILPLARFPGISIYPMTPFPWEGPMGIGPVSTGMSDAGERDDLGFINEWVAQYLMAGDAAAQVNWRAAAEATGTMTFWIRDVATGALVDIVGHPYVSLGDQIGGYQIPLASRVLAGNIFDLDPAHMPSCALVPYLLTDDPYFLEGAQATANFCPLQNNYAANAAKISAVATGQPRAMAWAWRDIFQAAVATPATTPAWILPRSYWKSKMVAAQLGYANLFLSNRNSPCTTVFKLIPQTGSVPAFMLDYICVVAGWIKWTGLFPEFDAVVNYTGTPRIAMSSPTNAYGWDHREPEPYYTPVIDARNAPNCDGSPELGWEVVSLPQTPTSWKELSDLYAKMTNNQNWSNPATWPADGSLANPNSGYLPWIRAALAALELGGVAGAKEGHDWLKLQLDRNPIGFGAKWAVNPN